MQFDNLNGILIAKPNKFDTLGEYILYGRVVYQVPKDAFDDIVGP